MSILAYVSCIIHDLGILGVTRNIQAMGSLEINDLFTSSLWAYTTHLRL